MNATDVKYEIKSANSSFIGVYEWKCNKCGHEWKSAKEYFMCPHCKSKNLIKDRRSI